jgi:hypothetical protein
MERIERSKYQESKNYEVAPQTRAARARRSTRIA